MKEQKPFINFETLKELSDFDTLKQDDYISESNLQEFNYLFPTFPTKTLGCLVSEGGTGKSFFALNLALSYACGRNSLAKLDPKFKVKENINIGYLSLEDNKIVVSHRLHALINSPVNNFSDIEKEEISKRFATIFNKSSIDISSDKFSKEIKMNSMKAVNDLIKIASNFDLLFIDTFIRVHTSNENDSSEMSEVIKKLELIKDKADCSIIFLHHVNKEGGFRGSSAIRDNCRWLASLTNAVEEEINENKPDVKKYVVFKVEKSNNSVISKPVMFKKEHFSSENKKVNSIVLKDVSDKYKYKEKEQTKRGTRKWKIE